ncbi:MAG TPA: IS110 family transposase [Syntrophorhabdales bacterium]|nr:IS110 family transposase [Syntrophorhabdales bacterium]
MNIRRVQDFVVKGKEVFVGLEDSKKTWKLAVRSDRMLIHRVSMEAKYQVLIRYLRNKFPECVIHLIYEAGFKGFNLFDRLTEDGIDCVVIPPHMVTEPKVNRVKTDKRDANRLALILENHDFKDACHVPDKERREDRQVSRTLIGIQKDIIRTRNRIHRLLDFHGIEVPLTPGRKGVHALKTCPLSEPLRMSLDILLVQLEQLWAHQVFLRAALRALCRKERYRKAFEIARSLPGIGWATAIRLILELGEDLSHFTTGKKIASFIGLTCSEYSSGETERKGRITGMGSGFLRSTLVENSWIAIRRDPVLLAKFSRVWRASGSKKKAIVAVARMLIVRFRACVIMGTPYAMGTVR